MAKKGKDSPNYKKESHVDINCKLCGKKKTIPIYKFKESGNFCNKKCFDKWQSKKVEIRCKHCGKTKLVSPSKIKDGRGKFCNNKCQGKYREVPLVKINCAHCGKEKWIKPYDIEEGGNFCNVGCRAKNKRNQVPVECDYCGEIKYKTPSQINDNNFCNKECHDKWQSKNTPKGEEHPRSIYINGYRAAGYDAYVDQLTFCEECRRNENDSRILQVKCIYCNNWFTPINAQVSARCQYLKGNIDRESRFYCSDGCKDSCPIFHKVLYPKGFKQATSREVQPELRKLVLERDNWECIKCGAGVEEKLHCHHLEGIEINPLMSADTDMCITLCKKHHIEAHKQRGCQYYDLRKNKC